MSEIKVNKISPRTNCGTTQLGDSGDTFTIPAGATITNLQWNKQQVLVATGDSRLGKQQLKLQLLLHVAGEGYFCNTTSGAITVNLPASPSAGAHCCSKRLCKTFDTNNLTIE